MNGKKGWVGNELNDKRKEKGIWRKNDRKQKARNKGKKNEWKKVKNKMKKKILKENEEKSHTVDL